eukprot:1295831-Prymnesium_polylepis.1
MEILREAFPVWVKMPNVDHLLMQGKFSDADAPQPWKLDVMGSRILCFEEPPPDRAFDGKLVCKLSGGGVVTGRVPYGQNVSYLPTYRLVVAANAPIEIDPVDRAMLNRIVVFTMPSTFVNEGDPRLGQPRVFQKVPNLQNRFHERKCKLALFQILVDYYMEYNGTGSARSGHGTTCARSTKKSTAGRMSSGSGNTLRSQARSTMPARHAAACTRRSSRTSTAR